MADFHNTEVRTAPKSSAEHCKQHSLFEGIVKHLVLVALASFVALKLTVSGEQQRYVGVVSLSDVPIVLTLFAVELATGCWLHAAEKTGKAKIPQELFGLLLLTRLVAGAAWQALERVTRHGSPLAWRHASCRRRQRLIYFSR